MKHLSLVCMVLAVCGLLSVQPGQAENIFAPLNKVRNVDDKGNGFGVRRQGQGRMNTNLLHDLFNPESAPAGRARKVLLPMLDGSRSTLKIEDRKRENVGGVQIISGVLEGSPHDMATLVNDNGRIRGRIWKNGKLFRLDGEKSGDYRMS